MLSRKRISGILLPIICILCSVYSHAQNQVRLPNIIYILADDLGYGDVGCYGQTRIKTPNIDELARQGKRYTSFYAGSTVCAPSRAALMTGKHTGHVSIRGNGEFPLPKEEKIIPEVLKEKGYATGMMGKWGLGLPGTSGSPEIRGWDYFSGHTHHVEGHFQRPDSAWTIQQKLLTKIKLPTDIYVNEWFTNQALEFIQAEKDQPFFLYLSFTLPHAELVVPDSYLQLYLNEQGESLFAPEKPQAPGQHYGPQAFPKAAYAAMVTQMDAYIGRIVEKVRQLNLNEHTIIIFTSDNGTHKEGGRQIEDATDFFLSSGPFRGIKRDLYEGGIRVPFVVRWDKKIEAGTSTAIPAANWDMMSSFASLAGISIADGDGVSQVPVWTGKIKKRELTSLYERPFYWEFYEQGYKQAVRKGKWKAIRYFKGTEPIRTELYDLQQDPAEKNDVSASRLTIVKELEEDMNRLRNASPNPAFQIN